MNKTLELQASKIAEHIKNQELSLFLGSGITTVQWDELFKNKKKYDKSNISSYLRLQLLANDQTDFSDFIREMKDILGNARLNNKYLGTLVKLNINHIWTTNFDRNIENIMDENNLNYDAIFKEYKLKNIESSGKKMIYKINGDIEDLENSVITQEQYEKHQERINLFSSFLEKELLIKKFLIIGYSFTDNIILKSIAKLNNYFNDATNECFNIIDKKTWNKKRAFYKDLIKRYKITPVILDSFDDIDNFINRIKHYCIIENIYISGSLNLEANRNNQDLINDLYNFFEVCFTNNYKIYSNHGEFLGYHLGACATKYAYMNNKNYSNYVNIVPIYIDEYKVQYRKASINETSFTILMYSDNQISYGMIEEFLLSYQNNNCIIPLFFTGKTPRILYEFMLHNKILFPELDPYWEDLEKINSLKNASHLVIKIIKAIQKNKDKIDRKVDIVDKLYDFVKNNE